MKLKRKFLQRDRAAENDVVLAAEDAAGDAPSGALRRRALLTGGALVAGAVGAGAAMVGGASPASADTGDPVLQNAANTVSATTGVSTTLTASSTDASPTLVLGNQGSSGKDSDGNAYGSPALRITQSAGAEPDPATAGGDLLATSDGNLWFTHEIPAAAGGSSTIIPATVHTDATSNSFVPLAAPYRILDTRKAASRTSVINASGNLNSSGQLEAGKTIHLDLSSLVYYGDAITANITVVSPEAGGWVLAWPGSGSTPTASTIDFSAGQTLANLAVSGIAEYTSGSIAYPDTLAITTEATTHVIVDVIGFTVANLAYVNPTYSAFGPAVTGGTTNGANVPAGSASAQDRAVKRASALRTLSQAAWNSK
ncbi:MAG TPA: hypothetical protein VGG75_39460 [Trebonia sp.]